MKNRILMTVCLAFTALCLTTAVQAKDKEKDKVIVTLNDGTTVEGYEKKDVGSGLKRLFGSSGSIISFVKVSPTADGKDAKTYKAKDIKGFKYVDEGIEFESQDFNSPVPFKTNKKTRGLFRVEKRMENGTVYQYLTYVSTGYRNQVSKLVTTYGVKLRGDDRIYNVLVDGKINYYYLIASLEKSGPKELAEKYKTYFSDKGHSKELVDDPTLIVRIYDEYQKTNPAISRTEK